MSTASRVAESITSSFTDSESDSTVFRVRFRVRFLSGGPRGAELGFSRKGKQKTYPSWCRLDSQLAGRWRCGPH